MRHAVLILLTGLLAHDLSAAEPIKIGSRREVFVDRHLINFVLLLAYNRVKRVC